MAGFLALSWTVGDGAAVAADILAAARDAGFVPLAQFERAWLGVCGPRAPKAHRPERDLWVLGDLFARDDDPGPGPAGRDRAPASLVRSHWGRYVALRLAPSGAVAAVLRDPSGAFEAAIWRSGGVEVVASHTPDWLMRRAPPAAGIDWSGVPALLADPLAGLGQPPLPALTVLDAGEMVTLPDGVRTQVWRPADSLARPVADPDRAQAGLRARVEHCTVRLAREAGGFAAELSGGLDSAIVAVALGAERRRCRLWLNAHSPRPETDERAYARRVADQLGLPLSVVQRIEQAQEAEVLARTAGGVRPGFNGADAVFDQLVASACAEAGVEALFTGKGGDALFFQGATPAVFADLWRRRGPIALLSPVLPAVARWTRRSVWAVAGQAVGREPPVASDGVTPGVADLLTPEARTAARPDRHPWVRGLAGAGPGKRMQVEALASNLAYVTACRRTETVDLVHPLMSQPLVEWCLRIPTDVLTGGRTDRFLARSAFAADLPAAVAWRRSKGDYTATFNREAAASLGGLREHLLDGRLVQQGVLDRGRTEALLDRDRLMWAGGSGLITAATSLESWIRCWEGRVRNAGPDRGRP